MSVLSTTVLCFTIGDAGSFMCDTTVYQPLCPGTIARCTCIVSGTYSTTRWIINIHNGVELCPYNFIELLQPYPCSPPTMGSSDTCGTYLTAANKDSGVGRVCNTSILTILGHFGLNGLQVECRDMSLSLAGGIVGNTSISIVGELDN